VAKLLKAGQAPTKQALWEYNAAYQRTLGATFAAYYIAARLLNRLSESDIQKVIKQGLIQPDDFISVHEAKMVKVKAIDGIKRIFRALPLLGSLTGFLKHGIKIPIIIRHYKKYPEQYDPKAFAAWKARTKKIFDSLD